MSADGADPTYEGWFSLAYEELRRLAAAVQAEDAAATLNPTALVHEAYVRLETLHRVRPESRAHFLATAARAMRRILIDAARRRQTRRRGQNPALVTLDTGSEIAVTATPEAVLALEDALVALERRDPRAAAVVQLRFFAGLSVTETAEALGLSDSTVQREWLFARAWLSDEIRNAG